MSIRQRLRERTEKKNKLVERLKKLLLEGRSEEDREYIAVHKEIEELEKKDGNVANGSEPMVEEDEKETAINDINMKQEVGEISCKFILFILSV